LCVQASRAAGASNGTGVARASAAAAAASSAAPSSLLAHVLASVSAVRHDPVEEGAVKGVCSAALALVNADLPFIEAVQADLLSKPRLHAGLPIDTTFILQQQKKAEAELRDMVADRIKQ